MVLHSWPYNTCTGACVFAICVLNFGFAGCFGGFVWSAQCEISDLFLLNDCVGCVVW